MHRDGHVEVDKAYYSVPPEYLGFRVWVRWDSRLVRIFDQHLQSIAVHVKKEPGGFSTQRDHLAAEKISKVESGVVWLLKQVRRIGPGAKEWAQAMLQAREGHQEGDARASGASLHLAEHLHPWQVAPVERLRAALSHISYRLRTIRELLKRHAPRQEVFDFHVRKHAAHSPRKEIMPSSSMRPSLRGHPMTSSVVRRSTLSPASMPKISPPPCRRPGEAHCAPHWTPR